MTMTTAIARIEDDGLGQELVLHRGEFMRMLGDERSAERFIQEAWAAVNANPFLRQCTPESLFGALRFAAQINLPVGGPLQQFHLTPRQVWNPNLVDPESGERGGKEWQVIPVVGYNGLITLAKNTGEYDAIEGKAVYSNDEFEPPWDDETGTHFKLRPAPDGQRGELIGVIGRALEKGADRALVEWIDAKTIRKTIRPHNWVKTPWKTHEEAMFRKSGVRRVSKYTAKSRASWRFALALEGDQALILAGDGDDLVITHDEPATEDWQTLIRATDDKADLDTVYHRLGASGQLTDDLAALVFAHAATLTKDSRPPKAQPSPEEVAAKSLGREVSDEASDAAQDPAEPTEAEWAAIRAAERGA